MNENGIKTRKSKWMQNFMHCHCRYRIKITENENSSPLFT